MLLVGDSLLALVTYITLISLGLVSESTAKDVTGGTKGDDPSTTRFVLAKDVKDYINWYNDLVEDTTKGVWHQKPEMEINRAWLTINSTVPFNIDIWAQSDECFKCDLMFIETIAGSTTKTILVNSSFSTSLKLVRIHPGGSPVEELCKLHQKLLEKGDYWVFIDYPNQDMKWKCDLILANDPFTPEFPILYTLLGLALLAVLYVVGKRSIQFLRRVLKNRQSIVDLNNQDTEGSIPEHVQNGTTNRGDDSALKSEDEQKKRARLRSLDCFRGLTLILMIFVNYGGGHYWFFEHSSWNGIYVADLVFPWFVFMMGVSMTFSFRSMIKKNWSSVMIIRKLWWRSLKLFILGFMLGTTHYVADLPNVRIFGVLQRLALTYLISAKLHYCFARQADYPQDKSWAMFRDVILNLPEWLANLALVALHLGIVYGLPVPGCPRGYTGPGGLSESGNYWNCTGGATQYVDSLILGEEHMYQYPTPMITYQTNVAFDPEGLLGTLNCVFLCFLGVQCGRIFMVYREYKQRIIRFIIWAVILGSVGALLTKCSQNDGWIPPNKNIWSLSFTLITGSFGYVLMAGLYLVIDVFTLWQGQPFIYPGMNSIVIYICHSIFYKTFPVSWKIEEEHWKLLLQCVWGTAVWVIVAYWLFVKRIFIAL